MTGCASMCCAGSASGRSAPAGSAARSGAACARRESGLARIDRRRAHRDAVEVLVFGPHALVRVAVARDRLHCGPLADLVQPRADPAAPVAVQALRALLGLLAGAGEDVTVAVARLAAERVRVLL